jgi:hypothetical protein
MTTTLRALRGASLLVLAASLWLAGAGQAWACGSCYGLADGPMIDAARLGIWFMLGTVALVQGGFAAFFVYLHRRASRASGPGLPPGPDPVGGREP